MAAMMKSLRLVEVVGSPFRQDHKVPADASELEALYSLAFENRVALLMLDQRRAASWPQSLASKYAALEERRRMTMSVIAKASSHIQEVTDEFVVFKSVKPYPATPNDTDILFLGNNKVYEKAVAHLLDVGYHFHEWAPQQRTIYDARGKDHVGKGKKGGTYYIDLYEEISTDYFAYLNKQSLLPHIEHKVIDGVSVPLLRPEPELAIVLFHNVFPERTFQVEHFYLTGYQLADPTFDIELFASFVEQHHMVGAVRANLTLTAVLHRGVFGDCPPVLAALLERWGEDGRERARFEGSGQALPHLFSPTLFWSSFAGKLVEWYSLRTALWQLWQLRDPKFFRDVIRAISARLGRESVYKAE